MPATDRTEMETQALAWLEKLGIAEPCGLDKLNGVELRDLARQIEWSVGAARNRGYEAGRIR